MTNQLPGSQTMTQRASRGTQVGLALMAAFNILIGTWQVAAVCAGTAEVIYRRTPVSWETTLVLLDLALAAGTALLAGMGVVIRRPRSWRIVVCSLRILLGCHLVMLCLLGYLVAGSSGGVLAGATVLFLMPIIFCLAGVTFFGLRFLSRPRVREAFPAPAPGPTP